MQLQHVFVSVEPARVRAGWRLLLQLVVFVAILLGLDALGRITGHGPGATLLLSCLYLAAVFASVAALGRFLDHRLVADLGLHLGRDWWISLGVGAGIGAFMISGIFFTERLAGWVTVAGPPVTSYRLPIAMAVSVRLVYWIAAGVNEELVFRGYQLKNLAEGLRGTCVGPRLAFPAAIAITSGLFGLAHLANANATVLSTVNIVLGGVLLSLPVLMTGELALPIGLHIAWNLFEGTVYGFPVSGSLSGTHLLTIREAGPALWTGGTFGPEGGLLGIGWLLLNLGLVFVWCRRALTPARRPGSRSAAFPA